MLRRRKLYECVEVPSLAQSYKSRSHFILAERLIWRSRMPLTLGSCRRGRATFPLIRSFRRGHATFPPLRNLSGIRLPDQPWFGTSPKPQEPCSGTSLQPAPKPPELATPFRNSGTAPEPLWNLSETAFLEPRSRMLRSHNRAHNFSRILSGTRCGPHSETLLRNGCETLLGTWLRNRSVHYLGRRPQS